MEPTFSNSVEGTRDWGLTWGLGTGDWGLTWRPWGPKAVEGVPGRTEHMGQVRQDRVGLGGVWLKQQLLYAK